MNNSLHILTDAEIQALWDEACKDSPQAPGWNRHIRFARALLSKLRAPVADERSAKEYGSPADVAQRIEQYLAQDGRMNSGTQLLYEAMKTLRGLAGESK